jgi:hypothetical protein
LLRGCGFTVAIGAVAKVCLADFWCLCWQN